MATTTTNSTTTHNSPAKPNKNYSEKIHDWAKEHLFVLLTIIVAIIACIALWAIGISNSGLTPFSNALGVVVFLFNVVILAYPLIRAIQNRYFVQIVIIVVTWIYALFALPVQVRALESLGTWLWLGPWFGPILFPLLALALNCVVAWLLFIRSPKTSDEKIETKAELDARSEGIKVARIKFSNASTAASVKTDAENDAKAKFAALETKADKAAKEYQKADKTFKISPLNLEVAEVREKISENQNALAEAATGLAKIIQEMRGERDEKTRSDLEDTRDIKKADVAELETVAQQLNARLELLLKEVESSPEKTALTSKLKVSDAATKEMAAAQKVLDGAEKAASKAEGNSMAAAAVLEKNEAELATVTAHNVEIKKSQRRASVKASAAPIGIQVAAFVFYTSWYGWVVLNFTAG